MGKTMAVVEGFATPLGTRFPPLPFHVRFPAPPLFHVFVVRGSGAVCGRRGAGGGGRQSDLAAGESMPGCFPASSLAHHRRSLIETRGVSLLQTEFGLLVNFGRHFTPASSRRIPPWWISRAVALAQQHDKRPRRSRHAIPRHAALPTSLDAPSPLPVPFLTAHGAG